MKLISRAGFQTKGDIVWEIRVVDINHRGHKEIWSDTMLQLCTETGSFTCCSLCCCHNEEDVLEVAGYYCVCSNLFIMYNYLKWSVCFYLNKRKSSSPCGIHRRPLKHCLMSILCYFQKCHKAFNRTLWCGIQMCIPKHIMLCSASKLKRLTSVFCGSLKMC